MGRRRRRREGGRGEGEGSSRSWDKKGGGASFSPSFFAEHFVHHLFRFLQVEVILGFGAAVVIVLTIIIVLILYLVLQCRDRRKRLRAARAGAGGGSAGGGGGLLLAGCDRSSNSSFVERSTVDFIVPGEMELTTAVRSVSSKCNGVPASTGHGATAVPPTGGAQPPTAAAAAASLDGKSSSQTDRTAAAGPSFTYPHQPGCPFPCGPPPRLPPAAFPVPNGYLGNEQWAATAGVFRPAGPPSYRAPPPPVSTSVGCGQHGGGSPHRRQPQEPTLSRCPCCGESSWHHLMPAATAALQYHVPASGPGGGYISLVPSAHVKDCPHSGGGAAAAALFPASTVVLPDGREVLQIPAAALQPQAKKVLFGGRPPGGLAVRPFPPGLHQEGLALFRPAWHHHHYHHGGPIANPLHQQPQVQQPGLAVRSGVTVTARTTQERLVLRRQTSLDGDLGGPALAFSDGETDRRPAMAHGHSGEGGGGPSDGQRYLHQHGYRRRASASGVPAVDANAPHYATMSRAAQQQLYLPWEQATTVNASPFLPAGTAAVGGGGGGGLSRKNKHAPRYSSQPFLGSSSAGVTTLNASILEYPSAAPSHRAASSSTSQRVGSGAKSAAAPQPTSSSVAAGNTASSSSSHSSHTEGGGSSAGDAESSKKPPQLPSRPLKGPPPTASKAQLERLNYKTSAVITKVQHSLPSSVMAAGGVSSQNTPRYVQPVSEQSAALRNEKYLFPGPAASARRYVGGGDDDDDGAARSFAELAKLQRG
jgi:hypothetical protein